MEILINIPASIIVFALGASLGSFINVVVYQLPTGLSVLWPPCRCPKCFKRLKAYDNVPIFGWLWLKGRCRYCQTKISRRYPLVETLTGIIFLAVFWVFQFLPWVIGFIPHRLRYNDLTQPPNSIGINPGNSLSLTKWVKKCLLVHSSHWAR
jgi:leader peptidase (prepilin peptidase) / N-methyltransferase